MNINGSMLEEIYIQMRNINNNNNNSFDNLKKEISSIQTNWSGDASEYFIKQYKSVTDTFDEYIDQLSKAAAYLELKVNEITELKNANKQATSSIKF